MSKITKSFHKQQHKNAPKSPDFLAFFLIFLYDNALFFDGFIT